MSDKPVLYLIDGSSYIYRAYYAIRHLSSPKGFPTNALFGFTKMLLKVIKEKSPDHLAVIFDAGRTTFRHEIYPDYKANRSAMPDDLRPQIAPIKEMVRAFNIPCIEMGNFEADDIIATIARDCEENGMAAVVVTGDKDLMQIVSADVTLLDTMKEKVTDIEGVAERFGVEPELVIDVLGLAGDTSDNIPGVPGVGEKTAMKLITQYGSLDGLLAKRDEVKGKVGENLRQFAEQALLSRRLATVDREVPIEWRYNDFAAVPPDNGRLAELFKEYGFTALMQELTSTATLTTENYRTVRTEEEFRDLLARLERAELVALDVEGTVRNPLSAAIAGISFSMAEHEAFYLPVAHGGPLPPEELLRELSSFFADPAPRKAGHDLKFAFQILSRHGLKLDGLAFDTMLASYLLNPSRSGHGLESLSVELLDHKMASYTDVTGKGKEQRTFDFVPVADAAAFACENADAIFLLQRLLSSQLAESGMTELFHELEMPLVSILAEMELCGVMLDLPLLKELSDGLAERLCALEREIYGLADCEFNINSPKQLGEVLFGRLKLPYGKKTKTGWSTDIDVLTKLAEDEDPHKAALPQKLLQYRSLIKLKSTYTDALPRLVDPVTGRIHTSYNQAVTSTGRLSSSEPNLQNIPVRTEEGRRIRHAFIAPEGRVLVSADYSQVELRVLAHLSRDPVFCDAFAKDEDIHTRTASEVFDLLPGMVTSEMRRQAKTINFGVIYGQSPFGLARELGITPKVAKEFIDNYFARHSGARAFLDACMKTAEEKGYVTTILGRRLPIPDIHSSNFNVRSFAQRNAVNYPIQGSAADIIKRAMVAVHHRMCEEGLKSRLIMQVHDELVFEATEDELARLELLVRHEMERAVELCVPLKVDLNSGKNWSEAH